MLPTYSHMHTKLILKSWVLLEDIARKIITLCSIGLTPFILAEREINAFSEVAKINTLLVPIYDQNG